MSLKLPRPVWLLGWVSLATDAATEAVYPLLPLFLTRVLGGGAVSLGVIEGAAEASNSVLKIISGRLADISSAKRPLVLLGYSVSSIARPFIAITTSWTQLFAVRMLDRVGKGIRTAPRDVMLARWATPQTHGRVYGFHRGMDHVGAIIGPLLASLFLWWYPGHYRTLFALTIVPGAIAVALIFFVHEDGIHPEADTPELSPDARTSAKRSADTTTAADRSAVSSFRLRATLRRVGEASADAASRTGTAALPRSFTSFMLVLTLFTLGNSTDAFLLLRLTDAAGSARFVPLMWAALHVVKAVVSVVGGSWSDRVGRRAVIAIGWAVYAIVYAGFAVSRTLPALVGWFLVYGFYFGLSEGTERALIADLAPVERRGLALGVYHAVLGIGALAASVTFGLVWNTYGAPAAFGLGSALSLVATVLLFVIL